MKKGTVQPISKEAFAPYGEYYNLQEEQNIQKELFLKYKTKEYIVGKPLKFGITVCKNEKSFVVDSMERHLSSEEVQFAGSKPIILSVADSDPWGNPKEDDVASFLLNPGDAIVLKKGIWHDACHCVDGETMYFFLSYTNGEPSETTWLSVVPDPVSVDL